MMVATAPVQRCNSVGPLLDGAGNLLGVVSLKVRRFAGNGGSYKAHQTIDLQ